jgi:hypothetical protein
MKREDETRRDETRDETRHENVSHIEAARKQRVNNAIGPVRANIRPSARSQ